jgi:tRNA A-37 threonylcarbamoyl transferase component Bud32
MATPRDRDILTETGSVTPERFAQIRAIFEAALERPERERRAFAAGACAGDAELLREVEAMLAAEGKPDPLLDRNRESSAPDEGRFPAGTVLAGRYRILGLLGQGGMGEVYKAFDLILNQTVALKFLAPALISEAALARFRNEVRIARQVSHPNVCRVYDLGMVEGLHFLSMEYIDGEDLASLLRRIGRLPQDKAIEFTRKICAGLSAAHERGVLHRDLKPANIMIDRRGQVRITDFGLAGLAAEIPFSDLRSGTPAYMSPEQKTGKEVTTRSDIYALGLILHEMFTGKARHETQSSPTELVKDLDPTIERLILRCLEEDPRRRPNSSLNIAMGLPGADPIAAALAAGETPSPEMVAASTEKEGFSPRTAWLLFLTAVVGVAISLSLGSRTSLLSRVPVKIPGDALAFKAQELLEELGYTETPVGTAYGFRCCDQPALQALDKLGPKRRDELLATGEPGVLWFWYRQHQDKFLADQFLLNDPFPTTGIVAEVTPPNTEPGMVRMRLLPDGRLVFLAAVAKENSGESSTQGADPARLFAAAGLDFSRFRPSAPIRIPPVPFDMRTTWTGTYAPDRAEPITVQAAWWRGRPVYFNSNEAGMQFQLPPAAWVMLGLFVVVLIGGISVAHHNFHRGRGDRAGAMRLAIMTFSLTMLSWLLTAQHVARPWEILLIVKEISWALFLAAALWCFYMGIEPYVRRHWPDSLISWTRLQQGQVRNPLVASHTLAGVALAAAYWAGQLALLNLTSAIPYWYRVEFLGSGSFAAGLAIFYALPFTLFMTMGTLLLVVLTRLAPWRMWIGDTAFVLLLSASRLQEYIYYSLDQIIILASWETLTVVAYLWMFRRCGLLSFAVFGSAYAVMRLPPVDWSSWYVGRALVVQLIPLAIAAWALWVVLRAPEWASGTESAA